MAHVSNEKWKELRIRMSGLGIFEDDIEESFILGGGPGGQKVNKTHAVVHLNYGGIIIRSKKSRSRDSNRFFARRELCDRVSEQLGIPTKDNEKILKSIKQKKRRKSKSKKKYS